MSSGAERTRQDQRGEAERRGQAKRRGEAARDGAQQSTAGRTLAGRTPPERSDAMQGPAERSSQEAEGGAGAAAREAPGWLEPLQQAMAEALPRLYGVGADPALRRHTDALLEALSRGELSIPLERETAAALAASPLLQTPDAPLVIEGGQLAWRRWQTLRQEVLAALLKRAVTADGAAAGSPRLDLSKAAPEGDPGLGASAVSAVVPLDPQQRQAVEAVLRQRLVLLQGGPGTGKTSTVARMLDAVLQRDPATRIQLAAPTGKAAARLSAATDGRYPCGTLHRLLESRGDRFARNRRHPLALDLLVVDEVSMVDLELMAALLEALPDSARLVLVGDPAQLPPIAPGAVLLDLQQPDIQEALAAAAITLTTTYRNAGAIAAVAGTLRSVLARGSEVETLAAIQPQLQQLPPDANLNWRQERVGRLPAEVRNRLEQQLKALATAAASCRPGAASGWRDLLHLRERLLLLSPVRRGPWGVESVHRELLGEARSATATWPEGLPVLCTRNRPDLGLANGDVGVLVGEPGSPERQVLFAGSEPLWIHPAQLAGSAEPALALTVHKAQGSEAAEVIVLLPDPAAEPRLLYTALTRARERALLVLPLRD